MGMASRVEIPLEAIQRNRGHPTASQGDSRMAITEEMIPEFEYVMWVHWILHGQDPNRELRGIYCEQQVTPDGGKVRDSHWRFVEPVDRYPQMQLSTEQGTDDEQGLLSAGSG